MAIDELQNEIEDLSKDLNLNIRDLVGIGDVGDVTKHLKETLWPFLQSLVEKMGAIVVELNDVDEAVLELAEEEGDLLTPTTAGVFANIFLIGDKLADALKARLTPAETELAQQIDAFKVLLVSANETLAEIIVGEPEDDDEDPNGND